jgi:hypothetical protein
MPDAAIRHVPAKPGPDRIFLHFWPVSYGQFGRTARMRALSAGLGPPVVAGALMPPSGHHLGRSHLAEGRKSKQRPWNQGEACPREPRLHQQGCGERRDLDPVDRGQNEIEHSADIHHIQSEQHIQRQKRRRVAALDDALDDDRGQSRCDVAGPENERPRVERAEQFEKDFGSIRNCGVVFLLASRGA